MKEPVDVNAVIAKLKELVAITEQVYTRGQNPVLGAYLQGVHEQMKKLNLEMGSIPVLDEAQSSANISPAPTNLFTKNQDKQPESSVDEPRRNNSIGG